jgi:hypothetical protein
VHLLSSEKPQPALGTTQAPTQSVSGFFSPFRRLQWPVYEASHSRPSTADDKNVWSYTSSFPHAFMACSGTLSLSVTSRAVESESEGIFRWSRSR